MNKLALILAVLTAFVLTSCEKENVADVVENNAAINLKHANFVLMQKGYVDEYGYIGDLYVDENDPTNKYLEIYQLPQTRQHERPYDGTLHAYYTPEGYLDRYECTGDPTNCWVSNGCPTWLTGTEPIVHENNVAILQP